VTAAQAHPPWGSRPPTRSSPGRVDPPTGPQTPIAERLRSHFGIRPRGVRLLPPSSRRGRSPVPVALLGARAGGGRLPKRDGPRSRCLSIFSRRPVYGSPVRVSHPAIPYFRRELLHPLPSSTFTGNQAPIHQWLARAIRPSRASSGRSGPSRTQGRRLILVPCLPRTMRSILDA
jgi:hypothetical protein